MVDTYNAFVRHVHKAMFPDHDNLFFQTLPSLRMQRRGETVVPYHTDSADGHPQGEINFLIPLTRMKGSASMYIESAPGRGDFAPLDLHPGELLRFDGNNCTHGNEPHTEEEIGIRMSLDFRLIQVGEYLNYIRRDEGPTISYAKPNVSDHRPVAYIHGDYYQLMRLASQRHS